MSIGDDEHEGYLKEDLDLIQQRAKLLVFDPPEFCDDGEELCL